MTPDPATPAERAAAVLRAAEAARAAGHEPAAPVAQPAPAVPPSPGGAADRLLLAADELAADVDDARVQLEDLHDALARLSR